MRDIFNTIGTIIAVCCLAGMVSFLASYGFYSGKYIANLQGELRLLYEYMAQHKEQP